MKKLFLSCCLLICGLMAHAQSSGIPTHLVIETRWGNDYDFSILLRDKPKINFLNNNSGEIHIETSENLFITYASVIVRMYYKSELSEVENISEINNMVEQQGDQLCFSTSKPNTHISIVDTKGYIIMSETIDSGNYYFSLSDLLPGTYIAKINDTTIKFIKR